MGAVPQSNSPAGAGGAAVKLLAFYAIAITLCVAAVQLVLWWSFT